MKRIAVTAQWYNINMNGGEGGKNNPGTRK